MGTAQEHSLDLAFDKGLQQAFPPVMVQLLQALLEPEPSFAAIAASLSMDPMLAGKVLHVVNTTNYAFKEKITDLERAAIVMGTADLFKLVISLSLQQRLSPRHKRDPEHQFGDWRVSLWGALAAEDIALKFCPDQARQAYLVGMLKDLQLFLAFCRSETPPFLLNRLATLYTPGQEAEEIAFWGSTHADLGHAIFLYWGLPLEMADAVRLHHDFSAASAHAPLARSVIYATRWAELLHAPEADPGELLAFELALASELKLDQGGMDRFRSALAQRFTLLLGQLGISQSKPEARLYEQSLSSLQSYYFLAQRAVSNVSQGVLQPMADTLNEQLRLFWNIDSWELTIVPPGQSGCTRFICQGGSVRREEASASDSRAHRPGWLYLPIAGGKHRYGQLAVETPHGSDARSSLPMYVHLLGLCLDDHRLHAEQQSGVHEIRALPFVLVKLDEAGRIQDATNTFLETFGLKEVPVGLTVRTLLEDQLGISPLRFDSTVGTNNEAQGGIAFAPDDHFPATPVYMTRSFASADKRESYLILGDVTRMTPLQALAYMHPDLMDALFAGIQEQVLILDKEGSVIFCDSAGNGLLRKNIFAVSKPVSLPREMWRPGFLAGLSETAVVQAEVVVNGVLEPHEMVITPLSGSVQRSYLLTMRAGAPSLANGKKSLPASQAARQRDTLTGLYSYSQFHMLLQQTLELAEKHQASIGVVFCDIASLHRINEEQGYMKGDTILRQVADAISGVCRAGRDYACRYGSDKFAVIVTGGGQSFMEGMAGRIHERVHELTQGESSVHIGLALAVKGRDPRTCLEKARRASQEAADMGEPTCWGG